MADATEHRLNDLRRRIPEVDARQAAALLGSGAALIDVREDTERATDGLPEGAVGISRSFLELRIHDAVATPETPVLLICGSGVRSLLAAPALLEMGYVDVRSVRGGFAAWRAEALPVAKPTREATLDDRARERYARHLRIPEVGESGQQRLLESRVLVVGAGGLGSPAAFYLAAAGIGHITVLDDDQVDRSNLQRQILHRDARVGHPKVESARETLHALNPDIEIRALRQRLAEGNVDKVVQGQDVVIDGSDNFATRYLLNDASVRYQTPVVHGAVHRFDGQVSTFWPGSTPDAPCYRCLFPTSPPPELAPNCAQAGVLGALPGVIGTMQAIETIKLLLGIGETLVGRLLTYDAARATFLDLRQRRRPDCETCGPTASSPATPRMTDEDRSASPPTGGATV